MEQAIRKMLEAYDHYFTRVFHYRYWLVIVDNHFENCYSIFIYTQKLKARLVKSYEIACFKHDEAIYNQFLSALKEHSNLSIEYRDTRHLIKPDKMIDYDPFHGHNSLYKAQ